MRRGSTFVRMLLGVTGLAVVAAGCADKEENLVYEPVDRVLIVSMPGVEWSDVQRGALPNLEAFSQEAAIADVSTRIGRRNATATDAYLTIGAGTRALAPDIDVAVAVDPQDRYGGVPTAQILERRLGTKNFEGVAYLASGAARDSNSRSEYGGEVGLLGQSLAEAGVARGVIANADAIEGFIDEIRPPDGYYARSAATALMDLDGIVPSGTVGRGLLADDPAAPFGTRLDQDSVMDVFEDVWGASDRSAVMVEASDLSRVSAYRGLANSAQRRDLRDRALRSSDELLGRLLDQVDPERDAVIVLSPVSPASRPALGLTAVWAPGMNAGYLESATTRREGYVQLADVAPTVLTLLGEDFPSEMEGRNFHVVPAGSDDRMDRLVDASDAARFRDSFLPAVVTGIVAFLIVLTALTVFRERLPRPASAALPALAYGALGLVPGTFLAGQFAFAHDNAIGHAVAVIGVGVVVAAVGLLIDRARRGWGLLFATGVTVLLLTIDVMSSARLQMNTIFGYSVAVAGRFTGLGNLAYALLGAAAIVVAGLLFERYGRRALVPIALGLVAVVVVDGLPMLGADVGGVMSLIPAFGVTLMVLAGRRIRWQHLVLLLVGAAATVLVFAFIDAARPAETHTHLARLADHVLNGRWNLLVNILNRRWQASFGSLELAGWGTILAALAVAVVYAEVQLRRGRAGARRFENLASVFTQPVAVRAAMAGLAVLGIIGLIANDSSVAVPFTVLIIAAPAYMAHTIAEPATS